MVGPPGIELGLEDRARRAAVFDHATADPRQVRLARRSAGGVVTDEMVVVYVGDGPAPVGVDALGQVAHHEGLEVEHEMAPDQGVLEPRQQEEPRRLDRAGGEHDVGRRLGASRAVGPDVIDARRLPVADVDPRDEGLRPQLGPAGQKRPLQRRHRVTLGVDGAAVEGAEPAVVARRPAVVGNRVGPRRRSVGVVAEAFGGGDAQGGSVHGRAGRHGVGLGAPCRERVGAGLAGHADKALGLPVVGLELVVLQRPVRHRRTFHGPERREEAEVVLAEAGQLAVGVDASTADGGGQVVDVPHEETVAVVLRQAEAAGLEQGVGAEEVPDRELELVVGVIGRQPGRVLGVDQVVAALLEYDHRPAGGGEHVGRRAPPRARAHDDRVDGHCPLTSSSLNPRGWTSPSKPM